MNPELQHSTPQPVRVERVRSWVLRAPVARPVATSFGTMHDRPAVMLELTDSDGATGYGEVWCNFPSVGAEHRARLCVLTLGALVCAQAWAHPQAMFEALTRKTHVLALQSGEAGPFAQCIAGLDVALWDLWSKKQGHPLWKLLGGHPRMRTYASGLSADDQPAMALAQRELGHTAFKLKVGFGAAKDQAALRNLRETLGESATLMIDANQAWSLSEAQTQLPALQACSPAWIEEPLRCDAPWSQWQALAASTKIPIATGENLRDVQFDEAITSGAVNILQPDIGKWGGFSGCVPLARQAIAQGLQFCPHWLAGGIGLKASMHLLAAADGAGKNQTACVEWDANPNPLREWMSGGLPKVEEGWLVLDEAPGLGVEPQWSELPVTSCWG